MEAQPNIPTTAIIPADQPAFRSLFPSKEQWSVMEFMAKTFQQAGALPKGIDTVPKLMVVLQAGVDSGLTPLAAMNSFYIVNGNVRMYGEQKIAQVIKAGHKIYWGHMVNDAGEIEKTKPCSKEYASITIERKDTKERMSADLSMAEAQTRGMDRNASGIKDPWRKHPENMLKFKVFDMVAKFIVPDALQGIQIDDEEEPVFTPSETVPVQSGPTLDDTLKKDVNEIGIIPPEKPKKARKKVEEVVEPKEEQPNLLNTEE